MSKHVWKRLVSAVVVLAMAFSILVVPASAASSVWAVGVEAETDNCYIWLTSTFIKEEGFVGEGIDLEDEELKQIYEDLGYIIYLGSIPSNAYIGFSQTKSSKIFWYAEEQHVETDGEVDIESVNWNTGTITLSNGEVILAINGSGSISSSSSGASIDVGGGALLAVGGVAVAAVTGAYLYTHPEVVETVKTFFEELSANIQNKIQNLIPARNVEEAPAV